MNYILNIMLVSIAVLVPLKAYAYLDPGTGSYIVQILLAGLFGVLFAIKLFWTNIKLFFMKLFGKTKKENKDAKEKTKNN
ncbi:hypothetical protein ACFL14_02920 [Patescibacteria group bacterium]